MIKGYAVEAINRGAWEVAVVDRDNKCVYTFQITRHSTEGKEGQSWPTTFVEYLGSDMDVFRGLAEAMAKMGILDESATATELKATKYHLEDMRKLTFMDMNK